MISLWQFLFGHAFLGETLRDPACSCGWHLDVDTDATPYHQWSEHVDAAYRDARTVTTVAELDALPDGAIIALAHGVAVTYSKRAGKWDGEKHPRVDSALLGSWAFTFPARVLQLPGEESHRNERGQ